MATSAERLRQYEDLFAKSQAYDPSRFQQDFERSYGEATNYNRDLIEQQSSALGRLQAVAPELRQQYSQSLIKNPTLQRSLISQAREAPIADYSTAVNLLGQRGMRMQDIMGKALSGYQTSAQQAQTAAENAWRMYQDMIQQEQFNRQMANRGGGVSDRGGINEILERITRGNAINERRGQNELWNEGANNAHNQNQPTASTGVQQPGFADRLFDSPVGGSDLSDWSNMNTQQRVDAGLSWLYNPLTSIKTSAGLLGNLVGHIRSRQR